MTSAYHPKLAVYKFSSCDGCQLSLLNLEDELLDLAGAVDIAFFLEATRAVKPGPYDIGIVEGSITTPHEKERIEEVRLECKYLIALGTCATAGGIQALRNFTDVSRLVKTVYAHPEFIDCLDQATAITEHVHVDLEIWGCPVNKHMVLEAIAALLQNRKPHFPPYSVCMECKQRNAVCVLVSQGIPCLGPATRAGCGAICPANGRGCYGCFGPWAGANLEALTATLKTLEHHPGETLRLLRNFAGYAPAFRKAADGISK